jgi:hypothetical protein
MTSALNLYEVLYWRSHLHVVFSNCVALTRLFFESLQRGMEEGAGASP